MKTRWNGTVAPRAWPWFGFALAALLAASGCGNADRALGPASAGLEADGALPARNVESPHGRYPLDESDRWEFRGVDRYVTTTPSRGVEEWVRLRGAITVRMLCEETINGRPHRVEQTREFWTGDNVGSVSYHYQRLREDRTGLYDARAPFAPECPEAAAATAGPSLAAGRLAQLGRLDAPDDTTTAVLRYPLHPGATWLAERGPEGHGILAVVEGIEVLDLPTGRESTWRIRYDPDGSLPIPTPELKTYAWLGRHGIVQRLLTSSTPIVDEYGRPGTSVYELRWTLVAVHLASD